jgi:hypothetical protein
MRGGDRGLFVERTYLGEGNWLQSIYKGLNVDLTAQTSAIQSRHY